MEPFLQMLGIVALTIIVWKIYESFVPYSSPSTIVNDPRKAPADILRQKEWDRMCMKAPERLQ